MNTDSGNYPESVHLRPEWLFTLNQNGCSRSAGIGVHVGPEYAVAFNSFKTFSYWLIYADHFGIEKRQKEKEEEEKTSLSEQMLREFEEGSAQHQEDNTQPETRPVSTYRPTFQPSPTPEPPRPQATPRSRPRL